MRKYLIAAAAAAAVLVAACGNDDNGNGNAVSLSSKSDVQREYGNLFTGLIATLELPAEAVSEVRPDSAPTLAASGMQKLFKGRRLLHAAATRDAVAATPCDVSGTDTETSDQTKSRTFALFSGTTVTVTYSTDAFSGCTVNGGFSGAGTTSLTGAFEQGNGADEGTQYDLIGSGNTPLQISLTGEGSSIGSSGGGSSSGSSSGSNVSILELGTIEQKTNTSSSSSSSGGSDSTSGELRMLTALSGKVTQGSATTFSTELDLGTTQTPLSVVFSDGEETTWNLNGPYRYSGSPSGCGGGVVDATTTTPLQTGDGFGTFTGGVLTLASGSKKVTLTFNPDGSATLSGAVTDTLSASDIQSALNTPACLGGLIPSEAVD